MHFNGFFNSIFLFKIFEFLSIISLKKSNFHPHPLHQVLLVTEKHGMSWNIKQITDLSQHHVNCFAFPVLLYNFVGLGCCYVTGLITKTFHDEMWFFIFFEKPHMRFSFIKKKDNERKTVGGKWKTNYWLVRNDFTRHLAPNLIIHCGMTLMITTQDVFKLFFPLLSSFWRQCTLSVLNDFSMILKFIRRSENMRACLDFTYGNIFYELSVFATSFLQKKKQPAKINREISNRYC